MEDPNRQKYNLVSVVYEPFWGGASRRSKYSLLKQISIKKDEELIRKNENKVPGK